MNVPMTKTTPANQEFYVPEEDLVTAFDLSWREAQFLQALLVHSIGGMDVFPPLRNPRQYIYLLRKKLEGMGVEIKSVGGKHYAISGGDRKKIVAAVKNS